MVILAQKFSRQIGKNTKISAVTVFGDNPFIKIYINCNFFF